MTAFLFTSAFGHWYVREANFGASTALYVLAVWGDLDAAGVIAGAAADNCQSLSHRS